MSQAPTPVLASAVAPGRMSPYYKNKWMGLRPRRGPACCMDAASLDTLITWLENVLVSGLPGAPRPTVIIKVYRSGAVTRAASGAELTTNPAAPERANSFVVRLSVRTPTARRKIRITCVLAQTTYRVNGDDEQWVRTAYGLVAGLVATHRAAFAALRAPQFILGTLGLCFILFAAGFLIGGSYAFRNHTPVNPFLVFAPIVAGYVLLGYLLLGLVLAPKPLIIRQGQHGRWRRRDTLIALCTAALAVALILSSRLQDPVRADALAAMGVVSAIVFGVASWYAARAAHP